MIQCHILPAPRSTYNSLWQYTPMGAGTGDNLLDFGNSDVENNTELGTLEIYVYINFLSEQKQGILQKWDRIYTYI